MGINPCSRPQPHSVQNAMPLRTFYCAYQKHQQHSENAGQRGEDARPISILLMLGLSAFDENLMSGSQFTPMLKDSPPMDDYRTGVVYRHSEDDALIPFRDLQRALFLTTPSAPLISLLLGSLSACTSSRASMNMIGGMPPD